MKLNETEIQRLAGCVAALRPDWPAKSLRTFITTHLADRAYRDATVAFCWVAMTDTQTPRLVLEPGPWWRATMAESVEDSRYRPPKDHQACGKHPGEWRDRCRSCTADQLAGEVDEPIDRTPAEQAKAEARQAIAAARVTAAAPETTDDDRGSA